MKKIDDMKFAEYLCYVRKKSADIKTQARLEERTKISRYNIQQYEHGEILPTLAQLKVLCEVLNSDELLKKGEKEIEFVNTHPVVKICFSDKTTCWKCNKKMSSVYGLVNDVPIPPDEFNDTMLRISKEKGAILEERRSEATGETHLVNVCPHCDAFIGMFYLHHLWYGETETIEVDDISEYIPPKEYW